MYRENCLCVGLSLFWYAGRILWSECKNPIRPKIPLDQSYVPTSWVFVTYDSKYFCVFAMWILDLCLCHTSVFGCISVMPPLGLALLWYWLFVCFFFFDFVYMKLFVLSGLGICVLCSMCQTRECRPNKGAPWFFFFEKKCTMRLREMIGRCVEISECPMRFMRWVDDAFFFFKKMSECTMRFMKWMDDAFFKNEWMYDVFYEMNERCV